VRVTRFHPRTDDGGRHTRRGLIFGHVARVGQRQVQFADATFEECPDFVGAQCGAFSGEDFATLRWITDVVTHDGFEREVRW
jgi:hypothetical protein